MNWSLIEKPTEKAKSQVHLLVSMPEKRGQPKIFIAIPTVLCGKFGFDKSEMADIYFSAEDKKLWIKPNTTGQRKIKQRINVVQVQCEPLKGMALNNNSEYLDYEAGPESVGIVIALPDWFFASKDTHQDSEVFPHKNTSDIKPGGLEVDGGQLILGKKSASFSKKEITIISKLLLNFGKTCSKEVLHNDLYQLDPNGGADIKIIDVMICNIRAKLTTQKFPIVILTHNGIGYEMRNPVA